MNTKKILKLLLTVVALVLFLEMGAAAQNKTDCANRTGEDIVKEIYAKIAVRYRDQLNHINVRINAGVVTLEGWSKTRSIVKEIVRMAKKTKCVKSVSNRLASGISPDCAPGLKICGAICIPPQEVCNICVGQNCK